MILVVGFSNNSDKNSGDGVRIDQTELLTGCADGTNYAGRLNLPKKR